MRAQNKRFMNKSGTTDVLSFPSQSVRKRDIGSSRVFDGEHLGDILISIEQARRQANDQNIPLRKEIVFLIVHSVLHLIGFDHATRSEQLRMHGLESQIWRMLLKEKTL